VDLQLLLTEFLQFFWFFPWKRGSVEPFFRNLVTSARAEKTPKPPSRPLLAGTSCKLRVFGDLHFWEDFVTIDFKGLFKWKSCTQKLEEPSVRNLFSSIFGIFSTKLLVHCYFASIAAGGSEDVLTARQFCNFSDFPSDLKWLGLISSFQFLP